MHKDYFRILSEGLSGELASLPPAEVLRHFENYRHNFLLDRSLAICYLNRFLSAFNGEHADLARVPLEYLLDKCLQLSPFDIVNMRGAAIAAMPEAAIKAEILDKTNFEPETFKMILGMDLGREAEDASEFLRKLIAVYPTYTQAAGLLLQADAYLGRAPDWVSVFKCPRRLQDDFHGMLFRHDAAMNRTGEAARLWDQLPEPAKREVNLNFAAEMRRAMGDAADAIDCYERSLALDPSQSAARFRLGELRSPSEKDATLPAKRSTAICLYSYNKSNVLRETLESLAASNIGRASVTVLLNGCTDDSSAMAEQTRALFPNNPYEIITLPVNIGAPAARNWLIDRPESRAADYVAFLDDDVEVPRDWLEWFLTVAERDPAVGVVGCKVVFPGEPAMLQFLYRYVGVATPDLLKLSLPAPDRQFDNGTYDFIRETRSVMGCLHLFRAAALRDVPTFDIRFSPSQVDDMDHDLCLCLAGWKAMYCGLVSCVHKQSSGVGMRSDHGDIARVGNVIGNDIKLYYKHLPHFAQLAGLDNLSLLPWTQSNEKGQA